MRKRNPELMDKIKAFINNYYLENMRMPSLDDIASYLSVHKTTAMRYLNEMNSLGILEYDGKVIATPEISEKVVSEYVSMPIVGSIRCGDPTEEEEAIEEWVRLPATMFGVGEGYVLRASGDSMVDAGINDGDFIVIRKTNTARRGDIIVALDEEGQNTLKMYEGYKNGYYILSYMNEEMYPDKKILVRHLVVQGIASQVVKNL